MHMDGNLNTGLPFDSASLPIGSIIDLGFLIIVAIYIIFSAILYYHWQEYSVDAKITKLTLTSYFTITIPLILLLGFVTLFI